MHALHLLVTRHHEPSHQPVQRHCPQRAPARMDPATPWHRLGPRSGAGGGEAAAAPHHLRGGPLPQPWRVLCRWNRHLPAGGADLHPQLCVLSGGEGEGACALRPRGGGAGGRGGGDPRSALRGAHRRGPRRPERPWRHSLHRHHGGHSQAPASGGNRGAHPRFLGWPSRRAEGDRRPSASGLPPCWRPGRCASTTTWKRCSGCRGWCAGEPPTAARLDCWRQPGSWPPPFPPSRA